MKVWVVIDIGCHECGVDSEPVGIYGDATSADTARAQRQSATGGWRDGGQTYAEVFEMEVDR